MSMLHLGWVLISFILPMQFTIFMTNMLMIPVYTWEFLMIYGNRIHLVKTLEFFKEYGSLFDFEMQNPIFEQFLYFAILALLFMSIGCFKLSFEFP